MRDYITTYRGTEGPSPIMIPEAKLVEAVRQFHNQHKLVFIADQGWCRLSWTRNVTFEESVKTFIDEHGFKTFIENYGTTAVIFPESYDRSQGWEIALLLEQDQKTFSKFQERRNN